MNVIALGFSLLLLLGNAFFVASEFALVSVRRSQIEPLARLGDRRARVVLHAQEHLSTTLAAAQLGVTVCSLLLGALAEPAVARVLEPPLHALGVPDGVTTAIGYAVALALVVSLHLVIGEMVPKSLALAAPERAALWLGPALAAVARPLRPVVGLLNRLAATALRLLRVELRDEVAAVVTGDELAHLLRDSRDAGLLEPVEHERLEDALELGRRTVREVLLGRERLITVDTGATPRRIEELAVATGYSRFPVVGGDGAFLGYLHVKDVLDELLDEAERDAPVPEARWRPIVALSERAALDDALAAMRRAATHLAVVRDRDGRTLGLVTLEDVLEELVGEVHDPAHHATTRGREASAHVS